MIQISKLPSNIGYWHYHSESLKIVITNMVDFPHDLSLTVHLEILWFLDAGAAHESWKLLIHSTVLTTDVLYTFISI